MTLTEQALSGWGNFPVERCYVACPDSLAGIRRVIFDGSQPDYIARGLGRAYGDSALNRAHGVVLQTARNRFAAFDPAAGVLECEAGVSFDEILRFFLPRGWFLPTTPGTRYVTVGGAIAADVHGKNHHVDGSFGGYVRELRLLTGTGEVVTCSPQERSDVFWATVGGMGLTGVIVSARIQLTAIESAYCDVTYRRMANLDETLLTLEQTQRQYRYSVAWIDCLSRGAALGRSVLMLAEDAQAAALPSALRNRPLELPRRRKKNVPLFFPALLLNPWSVKAFNAVYYRGHGDARRLVDFDTFFYPLDSVLHWNRIYGRRGFIQYQALLPPDTARAGLHALLDRITAARQSSFLAVLKTSGPASGGLLSFLYPGFTLAIDMPNTGKPLERLTRELDEILLRYGGRVYLAKDATTTSEAFAAMYPRLDEFRRIKAGLDPDNRFVSSQARRLKIVEDARTP